MNEYTSRSEAIEMEIVASIEGCGDRASEFNIDAIADEMLISKGTGANYHICVDDTKDFWDVVEANAL